MINTRKPEVVEPAEVVHDLISSRLSEHRHSVHGSVQESLHVFIRNGLCALNKNLGDISILEMGFGTGLNAILTFRENQVLRRQIHYTTVESFNFKIKLIEKLN
jgi:tRNA U34 5-methylaminomethyl-2-thiouridine-forming methyltransferase MnmC